MWKVYDILEQRYSWPEIYGPLPCKKWLKDSSDKPHKMSRRYGKMPAQHLDADDKKRIDEHHARDYAIWLAKRDNIALPETYQIEYEWTWFYSKYKKRKQKYWSGVREVEAQYSRIKAVHWRINSNKVVTIELPNWDFDPMPPIEETLIEEMAA